MGRQRQPEIRQRLLDACTEHALADGLPDRLAPLAAAAGTSDRMLLYHFGSRDLLRAVLAHARQRQLETFGDLLHVRANEPYTTTLGRAWTVMSGPHGQPYLRMFGQLRESTEQQLWPDFPPRGHHRLARAARPPPPDCCRSVPGGWTCSSTTPVSPAGGPSSPRPSRRRTCAGFVEANVIGVLRVTNAMLSLLRLSAHPRIVNQSSHVGSLTLQTAPGVDLGGISGAYAPSKTFLNALTVQYAKELADTSILVNSACPGYVATDLNHFTGTSTPEQGAAAAIHLATLPDDGPTGQQFDADGPVPW